MINEGGRKEATERGVCKEKRCLLHDRRGAFCFLLNLSFFFPLQ